MMEMLFSKSKTTFKGRYDYDFLAKTEDCAKLRQMQLFILVEKHLCYKPFLYHFLIYVKYFWSWHKRINTYCSRIIIKLQ